MYTCACVLLSPNCISNSYNPTTVLTLRCYQNTHHTDTELSHAAMGKQ